MLVENEMKSKLEAAFAPEVLEIRNDSSKHAGHSGDDGSGESHFHITIRAKAFADMNRIARHRTIHAALGKELVARIHALGLTVEA